MPRRALNHITDFQWFAAVADYELGSKSGRQIARDLGVSPATVSRRMKLWGAKKGSRVNETIEDLVAVLDRKDRYAAHMRVQDSKRRRGIAEANMRAVGAMVAALIAADREGDFALASPIIDRVNEAVGVGRSRRSKA